MKFAASKSRTSPALWLRYGDGSNEVMLRMAERSLRNPSHIPFAVIPIGVTAPIPVMATLRRFDILLLRSCKHRL
jgi:hypothetical protein